MAVILQHKIELHHSFRMSLTVVNTILMIQLYSTYLSMRGMPQRWACDSEDGNGGLGGTSMGAATVISFLRASYCTV